MTERGPSLENPGAHGRASAPEASARDHALPSGTGVRGAQEVVVDDEARKHPRVSDEPQGPIPAPAAPNETAFSTAKPEGQWQKARISHPGIEDRGDIFFAAVEMTRMPMILTDPRQDDNPIIFANRAFLDLTGYQEEEIIGRNCRLLQGPQTDRETVNELRSAIEARNAFSVEILNYKRDGTPFWNGVFVAPVYDDDGRILYFFASQLDVTRRRVSEQSYRQAQKMESIGQLTAGLAHDFNNLLQVVSGNLELLRSRLDDDRLRRYADRASEAAERGARLTKQLLAFARKTRLEPRATDLSTLINGFTDMLESTVGSRIQLQLNLRHRLPPVMIDPVHLEMALLNVVINARDAMAAGGTLTVGTSTVTLAEGELTGVNPSRRTAGEVPGNLAAGQYVALSITDEGEGMAPWVLERAAEPFFTTKATGKGTGLGLAMVQGFAQQSKGRLEIESRQNSGTTVRMLFPVTEDPTALRDTFDAGADSLAASTAGGRSETILVVEDSEDVLALAREHLENLGYRVVVAHNGDEALSLLESWNGAPPDLLFTDILMPGSMNGLVLAERVRERIPGIAVLLTTGYNEELVAEAPRSPTMDVLGKPYRRNELGDRVAAALARRGYDGTDPVRPRRRTAGPDHEG